MAHVYGYTQNVVLRRRVKAAFMLMSPVRRTEYIRWWRSRDGDIYLSLTSLNLFDAACAVHKDKP